MKGVPAPRVRRRRPGAAAAAYSHALTLVRRPSEAEAIAVSALRRGAHSRIAVLAHARHQALERAGSFILTDLDEPAASDVTTVAAQLSGTRPPVERAIVDVELRYGLDAASFARVLGLPTDRATERARAVSESWSRSLDPALMAWLGPGSCEELAGVLSAVKLWPRANGPAAVAGDAGGATVLAATGTDLLQAAAASAVPVAEPATVGRLLDIAPAVGDHASTCDVCNERLRMMTTVRTLAGQQPLETVTPAVAEAAKLARRRLTGPLPPSIEPRRLDLRRARPVLAGIAAVGVAAGCGFFVAATLKDDSAGQEERVARLLEAAPTSRLLGTPTILTPEIPTAALANNGTEVILWHAETSAPWLRVDPSNGRLAPSQVVSLGVTANPPAPSPGEAVITITGSDGSRQTIRYMP